MSEPAPRFDNPAHYKPEDLGRVDYRPPATPWIRTPVEFKPGRFLVPAKEKNLKALGLPNPRVWSPTDADWKLPPDWKEILLKGLKDRLDRFRSLRVFMDSCVRCGACADKCHFYLGGGDPKNMPVLRAELLRSVYRNEFTAAGRILSRLSAGLARFAGNRPLTPDVVKEWFYYFYQCTECRRCSVFCPYGIDTAEITILARELLNLVGCNVHWVIEPAANCFRTGNHLAIQPHGMADTLSFFADDIETITGVKVNYTLNRKGAEILFVTPSGDLLAEPGTSTCMGYLALFHELGLDYTWSTYASEGGNFGLFTNNETMKRLNAKIYAEAKRLGVKWIIGGECGHMWRVLHQYMDTMNGPADFLEVPRSPITGTVFENARSTKMIHIAEFTADLIHEGKIRLDPSRNDDVRATFHDSCNTSRGMGLLEEPRYVLKSVCRNFFEMPENTIREQTFCCGSGAGLGSDENMEMRLRGGLPRGSAVRYVRDKFGVNRLVAICAIDRATLPVVCDYWAKGVSVSGLHELVANALVMKGEKKREINFRMQPLPKQALEGGASAHA